MLRDAQRHGPTEAPTSDAASPTPTPRRRAKAGPVPEESLTAFLLVLAATLAVLGTPSRLSGIE